MLLSLSLFALLHVLALVSLLGNELCYVIDVTAYRGGTTVLHFWRVSYQFALLLLCMLTLLLYLLVFLLHTVPNLDHIYQVVHR